MSILATRLLRRALLVLAALGAATAFVVTSASPASAGRWECFWHPYGLDCIWVDIDDPGPIRDLDIGT